MAPSVTPTACASALGVRCLRVRNERRRSPKVSATPEVYERVFGVWYCVTRGSMLPNSRCGFVAPFRMQPASRSQRAQAHAVLPHRDACAQRTPAKRIEVVADRSCEPARAASPTPRERSAAPDDHRSRVRNAVIPATSTTITHPTAHASIAGGGGDVTENGFTVTPFAFAFAATAPNTAGCNA